MRKYNYNRGINCETMVLSMRYRPPMKLVHLYHTKKVGMKQNRCAIDWTGHRVAIFYSGIANRQHEGGVENGKLVYA